MPSIGPGSPFFRTARTYRLKSATIPEPDAHARRSPIRLGSFTALASLHPTLPVRWSDLRGRTGQIPASGFSRGQVGAGLLFLEATPPDGTRWSGSWLSRLLPGGRTTC